MKQTMIFLLFLGLLFSSCTNNKEIKFDKDKWAHQIDTEFPSTDRKKMLKDLSANYRLTGIKYSQLIDLLGSPNSEDSSSISYTIIVDYGNDIDPVYTKVLKFFFLKDSIITSFKIVDWRR